MAHSHAGDRTSYLTEQICTLLICALLGGVSVMLYSQNLLRFILAPKFFLPVLWGGIAILVLVALRAITLVSSGAAGLDSEEHHHDHACDCEHDHDHAHDPDELRTAGNVHEPFPTHEEHHPDHDHGHSHGWNPLRYVVLLLPIVLYFLNLPNAGFTASGRIGASDFEQVQGGAKYVENTGLQISKKGDAGGIEVVNVVHDSPAEKAGIAVGDLITQVTPVEPNAKMTNLKGLSVDEARKLLRGAPGTQIKLGIQAGAAGQSRDVELTRAADILNVPFTEITKMSYTPEGRKYYDGRIARMIGQYAPGNDQNTFNLARVKITCCAADAIPLNVIVMRDPSLQENLEKLSANVWVEVTGRLQFRKRKDRDEYVTLLLVSSPKDVQEVPPPPDPYIQ